MLRTSFGSLMFVALFRAEAVQAQSFLGKDMQAWLTDLDKGNDSVRRGAAFALGKIAAPAAAPALQKHLREDKDLWVREASAFSLGEIGRKSFDAGLIPVLTEALAKDASPVVRRSAAYALGCLGTNARPALPKLEAALKDASPLVRQNVAWALAKLGAPAIPALKTALHDTDALVKRDAAASMEPLSAEVVRPVVPDLVSLCAEENSDVRRAALGVLIKVVTSEDSRYIREISLALRDDDEEVRNYAALTLGNIGGRESAQAVPQLLIALKQKANAELRRQAAASIANIGPAARKAVPELIVCVKDSDAELRGKAAFALGGIGKDARPAYEALLKRAEDTREKSATRVEAGFALSRIDRCPEAVAAVPRILKVLENDGDSGQVRGRLIWALRVHYVEELRKLGLYPTFYKVLGEKRTPENKMLRYDCAYMLGMLQGAKVEPQVFDTLLEFLRDDSIQIFAGKKSSVTGIGVETGKGKADVQEGGKGDGRFMAVEALMSIGPRVAQQPAIVKELRSLANNPATFNQLRVLTKKLLRDLGK